MTGIALTMSVTGQAPRLEPRKWKKVARAILLDVGDDLVGQLAGRRHFRLWVESVPRPGPGREPVSQGSSVGREGEKGDRSWFDFRVAPLPCTITSARYYRRRLPTSTGW